jgi:hypothetical protein
MQNMAEKKQPTEWKKILVNYVSDKRLASRILKNPLTTWEKILINHTYDKGPASRKKNSYS